MKTKELYTPTDVDVAHERWGANCGPCALAAVFERPVMSVLDAVADHPPVTAEQLALAAVPPPYRGYMGIAHLRLAVELLGGKIGRQWSPFDPADVGPEHPAVVTPHDALLCMVEWNGPWTGTRGQAAHRHTVAFRTGWFNPASALRLVTGDRSQLEGRTDTVGPCWVFDGNYGWAPLEMWSDRLAPRVMPKRATGWRMRWAAAVTRTTSREGTC